MRPRVLTFSAVLLAASASLHAQTFSTKPCTNTNDDNSGILRWLSGGYQACEVRSIKLPLVNGHLNVNGQNGGIGVIGEDRSDVYLEARVSTRAHSQSDADSLLHQITIQTGDTIDAKGPQTSGFTSWSVSYRLRVPHRFAGDLQTSNGGITLTALDGSIHAETTNGGLTLNQLAGDIHAETTNGGIKANLAGSSWQGTGLSARTTNGGITVSVPHPYSAHLVASTVNGGTSLSVPGADQSGVRRREIDTNLGSGGPTLSFETTNGGVSIN